MTRNQRLEREPGLQVGSAEVFKCFKCIYYYRRRRTELQGLEHKGRCTNVYQGTISADPVHAVSPFRTKS